MLKYSTDELPPHERFAQWREVRAKNIYGVTIELERALQPAFQGSFSAIKVGEATLIELHASPLSGVAIMGRYRRCTKRQPLHLPAA
jgi:hypothetical protein